MEIFDWEKAAASRSKQEWDWMHENYLKPVTEQEYIDFKRSLRATDIRAEKAKRYSTARLRGKYKRLKEKYGFFI